MEKKTYLFKNNKYKNCKGEILWKIQKPIFLKILNPRVAKEGPFGQTFLFENIKYKNCKGGTLWNIQKPIFLKILNTRIAKGGPFGKTYHDIFLILNTRILEKSKNMFLKMY